MNVLDAQEAIREVAERFHIVFEDELFSEE